MKSLPLAYNRDLQEDKEPLFDALDTVRLGLGAMAGMLRTIEFRADVMAAAADSPYAAATDLAELLVASSGGRSTRASRSPSSSPPSLSSGSGAWRCSHRVDRSPTGRRRAAPGRRRWRCSSTDCGPASARSGHAGASGERARPAPPVPAT
jgi:hypothetical protein